MNKVLTAKEGNVKKIIINRAERRNALDPETCQLLTDEFKKLREEKDVRVLIVTGAGNSFCAGADLKWMPEGENPLEDPEKRVWLFQNMIKELFYLPIPTIAAIRGHAVGFGCSLALACDIRIAAEDAKMGVLFSKIGLMPDGGASYFMPRLVGLGKTLELFYTADIIDANECLRLGLVNRVVKIDDFEKEVGDLSHKISKGPPIAYRNLKQTVRDGLSMNLDGVLKGEVRGQVQCLKSSDFLEGVSAFFQKRAPEFKNE
jgi:enoyl-CoA hydratase/carnithine racemase